MSYITVYPILDLEASPTNQEVFDNAASFILGQGPCITSDVTPRYKYRSGGKACAMGAFMTDYEAAVADEEGWGASSVVSKATRFSQYGELFSHLVIAHDLAADCDPIDFQAKFRDEMRRVAEVFSLDASKLEEANI